MLKRFLLAGLIASQGYAFPWVARHVGRDPQEMKASNRLNSRTTYPGAGTGYGDYPDGSEATCPYNADHVPAAAYNPKYPYCGARDGLPGYQVCKNNQVPAPGDTAHQYQAPTSSDIRGPCPGLNTAANHNFLARDGITTFNELVDAQQNVYGVGYGLAVVLAVLGVGLDGDPIGTEKMSIGCDANSRTSSSPGTTNELGLDGHNKFEGDTSLTRDDYFLADGDNYKFNQTLFNMMSDVADGNFDLTALANYRYQRYQQSLSENGNFYFGVKSLLLFGAASFLYELFPSLGNEGSPNQAIMDSYFQKEEIPPNWFSRVEPYTLLDVADQINQMYAAHPVAFGGNTGSPNSFVGFGETGFTTSSSTFNGTTAAGTACLLYQIATGSIPGELGGGDTVPAANYAWAASKLNPLIAIGGALDELVGTCPLNYNSNN